MEEQGGVSAGFSSFSRSDPKIVGEKRSSDEFVESPNFCPKIQRLDPNLDSDTTTQSSKDVGNTVSYKQLQIKGREMPQVAELKDRVDEDSLEGKDENKLPCSVGQLDLTSGIGLVHVSESSGREKKFLPEGNDIGREAQKVIGLDLNTDAISSSGNDELSVCSSRVHGNSKSRDVLSKCGSSNVPVEEKDPMKLWRAMKQNGFLSNPHGGISAASSCFVSSSHGGIPAPRKRGRRSKNDEMKRKIEIGRKEEVDRFAKLAAPSGLLNELNPGIINHVRNKKQVLSIIENLVKSEKDSGNLHQATNRQSGMAVRGSMKNKDGVNADVLRSDLNQADKWYMPLDKYPTRIQEENRRDGGVTISGEDNTLGLKIHPTAKSTEESADFSCASVLTVKAATVASQWLELLHQDIKGRLSALRRSRKRVRAVITTELPFLILKEFPSNQDNDPYFLEIHKTRWAALFNQMELTLSEEEKQLESWLIQVRELQLHCDQGLQHISMSPGQNFLQLGMPLDSISADSPRSEKELAVRAAAASIYSTCNFLTSKENITCT